MLIPIRYRGIEAHASALIDDDYNLLFISIIGSDSCARGIAAAIVEKPTTDLEYWPNGPEGRRMWASARQGQSKYHMTITKLADNAVNALVYHEAFLPTAQDPNKIVYLIAPTPGRDPVTSQAIAADLTWNYINTLNTPLLPDWKDTITQALTSQHNDGNSAWSDILTSRVGDFITVRLHAPESKLDNLLTSLITSGKITF